MTGEGLLASAALGVEVDVELVEETEAGWWTARPIDGSLADVSFVVRVRDGHAGQRLLGWVADVDGDRRRVFLRAGARGRLPISDRMRPR